MELINWLDLVGPWPADERSHPASESSGSLTQELTKGVGDLAEDGSPSTDPRLSENPGGRVPGRAVALEQPTAVRERIQGHPDGTSHRASQIGDR
jgi:hypothetical protein